MFQSIGFLGTGQMGGALARAAVKGAQGARVLLANRTPAKAQALADQLGCQATDNQTVAAQCQLIFLGVKPQILPGVLEELAPVLRSRKSPCVLVSMAAGVSLAQLQSLAEGCPVVRIMPNTPVSVGAGLVLYTPGEGLTEEQEAQLTAALAHAGQVDKLPEPLLDAASAVAGCGPAFACQFLEALADGGVACSLPREKAYRYGAQMLLGTASLLLATGSHPGQLKDAVCSPCGTTIQGVRVLEEHGLRAAVMDAVLAAFEKNGALASSH